MIRHGNDTTREDETEDQLQKRAFIFAAWLDGMTRDAIKTLWRKVKAEES